MIRAISARSFCLLLCRRSASKAAKPKDETELSEIDAAPLSKELKKRWSYFIRKVYSPSPNTSQLAARMKARRTLRSLGEGGWNGFGEFRKDTSELCSEELHETDPLACPKCQGEMRIISFIDLSACNAQAGNIWDYGKSPRPPLKDFLR